MALRAAPRPTASRHPMELSRLSLTDFRSYRAAELEPDPGLTVVAAPNGAGKTNLLEAIHATITGRSHRAAVDAELVRHGSGFARVRARAGRRDVGGRGDDRAGRARRHAGPGHPEAADGQRRRAALVVGRRDREGRPLPAGGDAPPRRLSGGAPPLPRRHRRAARPPLGARPRRGGPDPRPAQRAAARDPRRGGRARRARLLGRAARPGRGAGHARAARGRPRDRGADRAAARRRGRADRARRIGRARLSRRPEGGVAGAGAPVGPDPGRGRAGGCPSAPHRRRPTARGVERREPGRAAARRPSRGARRSGRRDARQPRPAAHDHPRR